MARGVEFQPKSIEEQTKSQSTMHRAAKKFCWQVLRGKDTAKLCAAPVWAIFFVVF